MKTARVRSSYTIVDRPLLVYLVGFAMTISAASAGPNHQRNTIDKAQPDVVLNEPDADGLTNQTAVSQRRGGKMMGNARRIDRGWLNKGIGTNLSDRAEPKRPALRPDQPAATDFVAQDNQILVAQLSTGQGAETADQSEPQQIVSVTVDDVQVPVLVGVEQNPLLRIQIETKGNQHPLAVTSITTTISGSVTDDELSKVETIAGGNLMHNRIGERFGQQRGQTGQQVFSGQYPLRDGANVFWLSCTLSDDADIDHVIDAACTNIGFSDGSSQTPTNQRIAHRLGVALRQPGQDGIHTSRIPGLATTKAGTLIGVYDLRHESSSDLPGNIDVGMSRSTDGGRTWEPHRVIMDMGKDRDWLYDGIGDPAILVDQITGTIWVAATWSHGDRSWNGSGPGLNPDETGQFMLVRSDDDGATWSQPINITPQIKQPEWCFLLAGPGKGITMRDGTLVFAAQFQLPENQQRQPHSTIVYSRNHGATWQIGSGAHGDTTESQVVETEPGELMLNCRYDLDDVRVVMTTRDMGKNWHAHPTSKRSLIEPTACMASLINVDRELGKQAGDRLLFSNPDSTESRSRITIKASADGGRTWPPANRLLLDEGAGRGYSCLSMIDAQTVGILYESSRADLVFQRVSLTDLTDNPADDRGAAAAPEPAPGRDGSPPDRRPNILLIVGEDHGCELSCYGDPVIETPNIDALAGGGVLFESGYVTQSVCSPSRSTIFTGLYPHQNGQLGLATHRYGWFKRWPTTYSILKRNGYRTGLIGKTHIIPESAVEVFVDFRFQPKSNFAKQRVADYAAKAGEFFRSGDSPFFMTVNYPDAHWPLQSQVDGLPDKQVDVDQVQVMPYVGGETARLRQIARNY